MVQKYMNIGIMPLVLQGAVLLRKPRPRYCGSKCIQLYPEIIGRFKYGCLIVSALLIQNGVPFSSHCASASVLTGSWAGPVRVSSPRTLR